jgi:hypothetical protein
MVGDLPDGVLDGHGFFQVASKITNDYASH